ncbi:transposase, partial [Kitasatospora sp. NPDC056531]|uniref:transposase n=1 Tax=Kitasatospora sp. NPDC056531 TaxID=3345856 RepID=UPI0036A5C3D7
MASAVAFAATSSASASIPIATSRSCWSSSRPGHPAAEQQEPVWHKRYAVRSGIEGAIREFAHGHGMRRCRNRGQAKAHLQHVLTAIAVDVERLSRLLAKARPYDHRQLFRTTSTSRASRICGPG